MGGTVLAVRKNDHFCFFRAVFPKMARPLVAVSCDGLRFDTDVPAAFSEQRPVLARLRLVRRAQQQVKRPIRPHLKFRGKLRNARRTFKTSGLQNFNFGTISAELWLNSDGALH